MSKMMQLSFALLLAGGLMMAGCGNNKDSADSGNVVATTTPAATPSETTPTVESAPAPEATPEPQPAETAAVEGMKLNPDKFAGVNESMDVTAAAIQIDGHADDWNGIDAIEIAKDTDGNDLKFKGDVSLAWDGSQTLFVKGTLTAPGALLATQAKDSSDWWSDDILEIFLVSALPKDESWNKGVAGHYAANAKQLFESPDLLHNAKAANLSLKDGEWTVEMSIALEGDLLNDVKKNGYLYAKVGIELNSGSEYSLLGRTGGFWDPDNYIKLVLK